MRSILQLFGKSPFGPLQSHMRKVFECASEVTPLFEALLAGDQAKISELAKRISTLEHEADEIKNQIRGNLPNSIFLPVDRRDLLDLLGVQDGIADCAEDLGQLLRMRPLRIPESIRDLIRTLVQKSVGVATEANRLMDELDELVETSFSGPEAKKVRGIIENLGVLEHECDVVQWELAHQIFKIESELSPGELWMWLKIGNKVGDMANAAENVGKRLSLMIQV